MSDIDDRIRTALDADDEAFLKRLNEPGLFGQMAASFSGSMRIWTILVYAMTFVAFAAAVVCVVKLLDAETPKGMMLWALGAFFAIHSVGLLKLWAWMRMNQVILLRELKRIELRLTRADRG